MEDIDGIRMELPNGNNNALRHNPMVMMSYPLRRPFIPEQSDTEYETLGSTKYKNQNSNNSSANIRDDQGIGG